MNLYTYCWNNPVRYTDPDGHSPKDTLNKASLYVQVYIITQLNKAANTAQKGLEKANQIKTAVQKFVGKTSQVDSLFAELESSGIKFSREATKWITKTPSNNITWLEAGNESAGLKHIMLRHSTEFASWGYKSEKAVSELIKKTVSN